MFAAGCCGGVRSGHLHFFLLIGLCRGDGGRVVGVRLRSCVEALLELSPRFSEVSRPAGNCQPLCESADIEGALLERTVGRRGEVAKSSESFSVRIAEQVKHVDPVGLVPSEDAVGHALEFGETAAGVGNAAVALGQFSENIQCREVAPCHPLRNGRPTALVGGEHRLGRLVGKHPAVQLRAPQRGTDPWRTVRTSGRSITGDNDLTL